MHLTSWLNVLSPTRTRRFASPSRASRRTGAAWRTGSPLPGVEDLESRLLLTVITVDDDAGADFLTIQAAINAANANDTIQVAAGNYVGGTVINKALTIVGTGSPTITNGYFGDGYSGGFEIAASNVTIDGFNLAGDDTTADPNKHGILLLHGTTNATIQNNTIGGYVYAILVESDPNGASFTTIKNNVINSTADSNSNFAIYLQAGHDQVVQDNQFNAGTFGILAQDVSNVEVSGNTFTDVGYALLAVDVDGLDILDNTVTNNTSTTGAFRLDGGVTDVLISGNSVTGSAGAAVRLTNLYSAGSTPNSDVTISDNVFTGNNYGVNITSDSAADPIVVSGNDLSNNSTYALANDTAILVDGTYNYWGSSDGATIAGGISGPVDFSPFLTSGTDTDPGTPGFQGDDSALGISPLSPGSNAGELQFVIDAAAPGSTVYVNAGTYTGIIVNKDLTIIGAGAGTTFINGASPALTVGAGTVTVSGITYTNSVDTQPVILVNGTGSLEMTASVVNGSFATQTLVQANTSGSLNLGDTAVVGGNTFNISGGANTAGNAYIDDIASAAFSAVGNIYDTDPTAATAYIDFTDDKNYADLTAAEKIEIRTVANGILDRIDIAGRGYTQILGDALAVTGESAVAPYGTAGAISRAIVLAATGNNILVGPGTFTETLNINKQLNLYGAQSGVDAQSGRSGAQESILNSAGGVTPVVVQADGVVIDGFVIQGNTSDTTFGAGLWMQPGTSGTQVLNNIVQNNVVGVFVSNDAATPVLIAHNLFRNNTNPGASSGTDIYLDQYTAGVGPQHITIDNNTFTNGSFVDAGWAIGISNTDTTPASNLIITNNHIDNHGRGMYFFSSDQVTITGNVISGVTHYGIGIFDSTIPGTESSNFTIDNNTITTSPPGVGISIDNTGYTGPLTVTNSGDVEVFGTTADDSVTLANVGGQLTYTLGGNSFDITGATSFTFHGDTGSDVFTIDYTNFTAGDLAMDIVFDGGTGAGSDSLVTFGGTFASGHVVSTGAGAGTIQYDANGLITFSNLEPITDDNAVTNYTIDATAGADAITIASSANNRTLVSEGANQFESVDFKNKTNVTINGLGSADTFSLNVTTPAAGLDSLTVDGGIGSDTLTTAAGLSLPGTIDLSVDTVNLNHNLTATTLLTGTATLINVNNNTAQIQDGVDVSGPGALVNIAASTYTENVTTAGKSVTLAAAGAVPGQVTLNGDLTLDGNDALQFQLNGTTAGTTYDDFVINGVVTLGGAALVPTIGYGAMPLDRFTIINNDGADPVGGIFNGLPEGFIFTVGGVRLRISYVENHPGFGDGNDVSLTVVPPPVLVDYTNGNLTITGTGRVDDITVEFTGTNTVMLIGNDVTNFFGSGANGQTAGPFIVTGNLTMSLGNGDDRVFLRGEGPNATFNGGTMSIDLGAGDDIVTTTDIQPPIDLTDGLTFTGDLSIIGGSGSDNVILGGTAVADTFTVSNLTIDLGADNGNPLQTQGVTLDRFTANGNVQIKNGGTANQSVQIGSLVPVNPPLASKVVGNLIISQADGASSYAVGVHDTDVGGLVSIANGSGSGAAAVTIDTTAAVGVAKAIGGSTTIVNGNNNTNSVSLVGTAAALKLTGNITVKNGGSTANLITVTDVIDSGTTASTFTNGLSANNQINFTGALRNTFLGSVAATNGTSTGVNAITATRLSARGLNLTNGNATTSNSIIVGGAANTTDRVVVNGNLVLTNGNATGAAGSNVIDVGGLTTQGQGNVTIRNGTSGTTGTSVRFGAAGANPGANVLSGNLSINNQASTGPRSVTLDRLTVNGTTGAAVNETGAGTSALSVGTVAAVTIGGKLDVQDGAGSSTMTLSSLVVGSVTYNDLGGGSDTVNIANAVGFAGITRVNGITRLNLGLGSDTVNIGAATVGTGGTAVFNGGVYVTLGSGNDNFNVGANANSPAFSSANKFQIDGGAGDDTVQIDPLSLADYVVGTVPKKLKQKITGFEHIL